MEILLEHNWKNVHNHNLESSLTELLKNTNSNYMCWTYSRDITISDNSIKTLTIEFDDYICKSGGACLYINSFPIPLGAKVNMPIIPPVNLKIEIKILANSVINLRNFRISLLNKEIDLTEEVDKDNDILVITPDYPSTHSLYACGFVHSRVREYVEAGLKVQVAIISSNWYQTSYKINNIDVFKGNYLDLKKLLSKKLYKVIVTHFVSEEYLEIFDGYVQDEKLIFICHGPETTFEILPNKSRPYFTAPIDNNDFKYLYKNKKRYVQKYAYKENVTWVFVSEWLKNYSEELLKIKFKKSQIINNTINEKLFPYNEKKEDDRKKILILRKFDNIAYHSIDQAILAIRELSRRDFFDELEFNIYGDGNYFDELLEPVKNFKNVHIIRGFIPNERITEIHKGNGILLIPSRHDAHAVSMGEGASSGLVVVGSRVTSNPFFMNESENHTLADPENPKELADIVERLYRNPKEFLKISKNMSLYTRRLCSIDNTVQKEINLITQNLNINIDYINAPIIESPILTIIVPAYNIERYVDKCLYSLINHDMNRYLEIIVVNDGSTDNTLQKIQDFIRKYKANNIRVINKENGGHGSTINVGIKEAKGKYLRLIDGDDWVDSENLAKQINLLSNIDIDLMLTKGCYEYLEREKLENIINYDFLHEGTVYNFDDLTYKGYGFSDYGPLLTTSTYKTDVLRKANFKISEKKPYVDMEFNAFSLKYVNTVIYYDLDIYRYLIGREGQTISRDFWKKKYKDHEYILFNLCNYVMKDKILSNRKKKYVSEKLIARMVDSQIFMYDQVVNWEELEIFLKKLKSYSTIYSISIKYIKEKAHDSDIILKYFSSAIKKNKNIKLEKREPIINLDDSINLKYKEKSSLINYSKRIAKWIVPHEVAIRISKKLH